MSSIFDTLVALVVDDDWRLSDHGLQRLEEHSILASDLAGCIGTGVVVEDYPDYHAGPCALVLQTDTSGPVHVLWGLEKGTSRPAVLITAYRPDAGRWNSDNRSRR